MSHKTAMEQVLRPLFRLLLAYLETGQCRCRDVYLNERLRYAPHLPDPQVRRAFFSEVIPRDEEAVLEIVGPKVRDSIAKLLHDLHGALFDRLGGDAVNLLAIGDCLIPS